MVWSMPIWCCATPVSRRVFCVPTTVEITFIPTPTVAGLWPTRSTCGSCADGRLGQHTDVACAPRVPCKKSVALSRCAHDHLAGSIALRHPPLGDHLGANPKVCGIAVLGV